MTPNNRTTAYRAARAATAHTEADAAASNPGRDAPRRRPGQTQRRQPEAHGENGGIVRKLLLADNEK